MPTWRGAMSSGANKGGYEAEVRDLLTKFDSALTDKQIMYVNLHPLVKDKVPIEGYKHIVKFPDDVDSYSFLNAVDVLITDYSSVFFDFPSRASQSCSLCTTMMRTWQSVACIWMCAISRSAKFIP